MCYHLEVLLGGREGLLGAQADEKTPQPPLSPNETNGEGKERWQALLTFAG